MLRPIIIAVYFVLAVISFGVAQTQPETQPQPEKEPIIFSPGPSTAVRFLQEMLRLDSQGKTTAFYFDNEEFQSFVGISEAQQIFLWEKIGELESPDEKEKILVNSLNRWQELPAEELARLEDTYLTLYDEAFNTIDSIFKETLTPSQLQLINEYHLATPGFIAKMVEEIPFIDSDQLAEIGVKFAAYEALDLSDEQKEALAKLQKESEEEMRPLWGEVRTFTDEVYEKAIKAESQKDAMKLLQEILPKAIELKDKATAITKKTKEKLEANLTPEQKQRLAQIREKVPKKLAKIKKELEKKKAEAPKDDSWKDAWKPGDPIPEDLQAPEPKRRFPFKL